MIDGMTGDAESVNSPTRAGRIGPVDASTGARRVGHAELVVESVGDATVTREVMEPGWRWSKDVKPIVGTDFCRAFHQLFVVSVISTS